MLVGYGRISISEILQTIVLQRAAIVGAGADLRDLHADVALWAKFERSGL